MSSSLSDAQVYAQQLLPKRHGYPLWVPEPYGNSVPYRIKGIRVGDVGYVTEDGAFETLFNVRASPSDPINYRGVPDGYEQVHIPFEDIAQIANFHQPNCVVTSASTRKRAVDVGVSTADISAAPGVGTSLQYSWTTSQGAILHLPTGACRLTCPAELFRDVALRGAKNWYKFANVTLRRGVANGALYLITGCDKTNSWMVGAFSDRSSEIQTSFKLSTIGMCNACFSYSYSWDTSTPAVFRTGPSSPHSVSRGTELHQRHSESIAQDDTLFASDAPNGVNQCVFIRGYRIMLRTSPVTLLLGGQTKVEVSSISSTNPKGIVNTFFDHRYTNQPALSNTFVSSDEQYRYQSAGFNLESPLTKPDQSTSSAIRDGARVEYLPSMQTPCHPSTLMNELLLYLVRQASPQATVSLVHDDEWMSLQEADIEIPPNDILLARMLKKYSWSDEPLGTFLRPRDGVSTVTSCERTDSKTGKNMLPTNTSKENGKAQATGQVVNISQHPGFVDKSHRGRALPSLVEVTNAPKHLVSTLPLRRKKPTGRPHTDPMTGSPEKRRATFRNKSCDSRK